MTKKEPIHDWEASPKELRRTIKFVNFQQALRAMNLIGEIAEKLNHHPDWYNSYNRLEICLSTHTEGKVTQLDYQMANEINALLKKHFSM